MFAAIARSYDLNNRVHSFGLDQRWRRVAVRSAAPEPGDRVLDAACGTGDLTELLARSGAVQVVGLDFTQPMLDLAEHKRRRLPSVISSRVRYLQGDAQALPFDDAQFDAVTIAFGIRNVQAPEVALGEFARVLKPGGRLAVLEFDRPRLAPIRWANAVYSGWIMPRTASLLSRDRSGAYRYLPRSIDTFLSREKLIEMVGASGFSDVSACPLTFGICTCYRAIRK